MNINKMGLTLVELLVVVFILFVFTIFSVVEFSKFLAGSRLQELSENMVSILRTAHDKTLGRENGTVYGVHFQADKYVLFADKTYVVDAPTNVSFQVPNDYTISVISLNGDGNDVVFEPITGATGQSGTITIEKQDGSYRPTTTIQIYANGIAEIQ